MMLSVSSVERRLGMLQRLRLAYASLVLRLGEVRCEDCGRRFPSDWLHDGLCAVCKFDLDCERGGA